MKQTIHLLALLVLLLACNNKNKQSDTAYTYTDYSLAYLIDGKLYFHNFEENRKAKFEEETESILNFIFDKEGEALYCSVERDNTL